MPIATVALAEVRSGLAARKTVVTHAGCIDDIGSEKIGAAQRDCIVLAIDAIACAEQIAAEIIADRVDAGLAQIAAEQRVIVGQLVIDAADPVLPVIDVGIAIVHLAAGIVRLRQERCELQGRCAERGRADPVVDEWPGQRDGAAVIARS